MLQTTKGYYENGQIILEEAAPVQKKTEVMITFLDDAEIPKRIKGKPRALKGKISIPDDFNESLDDLKDYM